MIRGCKLTILRVFVHDWETAVDFYAKTLGLVTTFCSSDMGWAQFDTGECNLAIERLSRDDVEAPGLVGRFVGASIEVKDILAVHAELVAKGVDFLGPPERQAWGGTLAHFRDPEDNVLTLLGTAR